MAALNFNANNVAPSSGFEIIPAGTTVELHATEAEVKPAKSGNGDKLDLTFEVLQPEEYKGRKIWESLNIAHNNPVAQKIGQERLSALCHATGYLEVSDTEELLWKPFVATLDVETYEKRGGGTGEKNVVKKYHSAEAEVAPPAEKAAPAAAPAREPMVAQRAAPATSATKPPSAGPAVPWKRSA